MNRGKGKEVYEQKKSRTEGPLNTTKVGAMYINPGREPVLKLCQGTSAEKYHFFRTCVCQLVFAQVRQ